MKALYSFLECGIPENGMELSSTPPHPRPFYHYKERNILRTEEHINLSDSRNIQAHWL